MTGSSLILRCAVVQHGEIRRSEEEAVEAYEICVVKCLSHCTGDSDTNNKVKAEE